MSPLIFGAALLGGVLVRALGKSKKTGSKPWHKLTPVASVAIGMGVSALSGGEIPVEEVLAQGGVAGASATWIWETVKGAREMFRKAPQ